MTLPSHPINEFSVIREINKISKEHYYNRDSRFDHRSYLKGCLRCLREFFRESPGFDDKYLFCALTLKGPHNEGIEVIKLDNEDTGYDFANPVKEFFEPIIENLLKAINNGQCLSLTSSLLKSSADGKVLFFTSKSDYDHPIKPYAGQEADAKVRFFPLSLMKSASDDFEEFLNDHRNVIEEFRSTLVEKSEAAEGSSEYTPERIGKLLWYYKKLELTLDTRLPDKDFAVHFFRPSFIEFEHNILLSLGTSQLLQPHQVAFLGLLVYRIASQMAIEKIKEFEMIQSLSNVSVSTHAIKTAINGLLSPPLNSLSQTIQFRNNHLVQLALRSRDKLLALTEIINLMSKLTSLQLNKEELRSALTSSNLFSTVNKKYDLTRRLREILALLELDLNRTTIKIAESTDIVIDSFFVFDGDLFPTDLFYDLLVLTIVENCLQHGYSGDNDTVVLDIALSLAEKSLAFSNQPKSSDSFTLNARIATGNIKLFFTLFDQLKLGEIRVSSTDKFRFILRSR